MGGVPMKHTQGNNTHMLKSGVASIRPTTAVTGRHVPASWPTRRRPTPKHSPAPHAHSPTRTAPRALRVDPGGP